MAAIDGNEVSPMSQTDVGKKIKELRLAKGLTLEQVANHVGVGKSTVRKWETGMIANMRRDKIAALAGALGTTPALLLGWEDEAVEPTSLPVAPEVAAFEGLTEDEREEMLKYAEFLISRRKK